MPEPLSQPNFNETEEFSMLAKSYTTAALLLATQACCGTALAAQSQEERTLNELRNTVVNLLQALVERGVVTSDQAQALVRTAQEKAAADAAAVDAQEAEDAGAVRVPYVPEIVKEEIRRQVAAELAPEVTREVVEQAKSEEWGVPAALPDWIRRVRWYGDVRVRGQSDLFARDNAENAYLDFLTVNDRGGVGRAGIDALENTTEDRYRLRARLRLGLDAELGWGWGLGARLATGTLRDPVSQNLGLGTTSSRYQTSFDLLYARWYGNSATGRHVLNFNAGRIANPWLSYDLVWDPDLTFEGVALNYRLGLMRDDPYSHYAYVTLGAFPIQEVELSDQDKWLFGGQLGVDWKFAGGNRVRLGLGYYQYDNIVGERNALDSNLLDYTAPQYLQRGNTLFDIRNTADPNANLFALAADYHLANAALGFELRLSPNYRAAITAEYVKNIGYDAEEVFVRRGELVEARDQGYQTELSFGATQMARTGAWRVGLGYRYLERDAVLDAFTDSDFHLGGTDAKGYFIVTDYAFTPRVVGRLRYLSANEIDGPPLGIDIVQLDLNALF